MPETSFGQELYESIRPIPAVGDTLEVLADTFGTMAAELELLVREDEDGNAPWSIIHDADRAPVQYLPYIAQFPGQTIPVGTPEAEARQMIKQPSNQERGGIEKMAYEAQLTLTGTKYVRYVERDGDEFTVSFFVRTAECPDAVATAKAIELVKPAGLLVNLVVTPTTAIDELIGTTDALTGDIDSL